MMMPLSARLLLLIFAGASGAFGAFGGGALPVAAAGLESPPAQSVPPAALLASVRADAARRAGVAEGEVRVVRSEGREWPDGGLGCPRPGEFYIQVITPGYLIVLQAGGRQYEYHTDSGQRFTLCREGAGTGLPATGRTVAGNTRWLPLWGVLALGLAAGAMGVAVARRRGARRGG
ncbi:MAG TPA: hypothetical protein VHQ00_09770 [Chloroflexota bacterium]|nr:hypothetical protein [Chloroflexota bacterium]